MKKLCIAALAVCAGLSTAAHAGFISGTSSYRSATGQVKQVALQGLEWMPLAHTANLSRDQLNEDKDGFTNFTDRFNNTWTAADGWRFATRAETETLIGSLWGGVYSGFSSDNAQGANWFSTNFGMLAFDSWSDTVHYGGQDVDIYGSDRHYGYDWTDFGFGAQGECGNAANSQCLGHVMKFSGRTWDADAYNVISKKTEKSYVGKNPVTWRYCSPNRLDFSICDRKYYPNGGGYFHESLGLKIWDYEVNNNVVARNVSTAEMGSLLVRTTPRPVTPTATVSAPNAAGLFLLGLCGVVLSRRRNVAK